MGVFEFIIILVIISTVGKVLSDRRARRQLRGDSPKGGHGDFERIRDTLDDLSGRLQRLEEERDFYKDLLDAPGRHRAIPPPDAGEDSASAAGSS